MTILLAVTILASTSLNAFAYSSLDMPSNNNNLVIVKATGIYINDTYYTQEQFMELLDVAQEINVPKTRSAAAVALVSGTWWIPGVGQVVITTAGAVLVAGATITVGSWAYNAVKNWFAARAEIANAKTKIPERLKDNKGEVDLGKFNEKVSGRTTYKEKGGWQIDKDTAGHKGSRWKLKDKQGNRVASLNENGKVVGK